MGNLKDQKVEQWEDIEDWHSIRVGEELRWVFSGGDRRVIVESISSEEIHYEHGGFDRRNDFREGGLVFMRRKNTKEDHHAGQTYNEYTKTWNWF